MTERSMQLGLPDHGGADAGVEEGWTGRKCPHCKGTGENLNEEDCPRSCQHCGGTGDEYGPLSKPAPVAANASAEALETERQAFQKWFEADAMPLEHSNWFRRDEDGDYEIDHVDWCWRGWTARSAALATFQPDGERREAIARIIDPKAFQNDKDGVSLYWSERRTTALADADLILASGLVQNEAGIRRDEREKCAKIADREAEFWQDAESSSARIVAANIRSARDGGAET